MRERGIPFAAPMVRALLAGTKTQTRRAIKLTDAQQRWLRDRSLYLQPMYGTSPPPNPVAFGTPGLWRIAGPDYPDGEEDNVWCHFGQPGDRLWVREAWRTTGDGGRCNDMPPRDLQPHPVWYEAAGAAPADECAGKYRPPMFMPRWASRILLEITQIRVQRLQEISEEDAKAEGLSFVEDGCARWGIDGIAASWCDCPITAYAALWDQINGAGNWQANPWVWVVSFRRIKP